MKYPAMNTFIAVNPVSAAIGGDKDFAARIEPTGSWQRRRTVGS